MPTPRQPRLTTSYSNERSDAGAPPLLVPTWLSPSVSGVFHGLRASVQRPIARAHANVSLEFNHPNNWDAVIADGAINLQMHFNSEHPTIKCEGTLHQEGRLRVHA